MTATSNDRVGWSRALVALGVLALLVVASLATLTPPSPVGVSASATDFSSARAMKHLATIAARPHRMGSVAHDEVRSYLVHELGALGLAPEVQETSVAQLRFTERWGWPARVATVKNIVARRKGTEGGPAVLVMAHYDTRSMTPGAGDDGAGVAALLETARALTAGERSRRDVVFLITDGEELGLLGAKAFLDEHPAAKEAALVLNFDARGDKGAVLMFQTSENASHLVRELARTAPHPIANSLSQAVYKRMPNDSDLSEFLPTGVDAMNFGYIGGLDHYILPGFAIGWFIVAGIMRLVRSGMIDVLDSDFVKLARIKGAPEYRVIWVHALKNALIPVLTFMSVYFTTLVTTAIVVETVFAWPGIGRLVYEGIKARDFPIIQAVVLVTAILVAVVNLTMDCLYGLLDPRIRHAR